MNKITHFSTTTQAAIVELFGAECLETGEVSATLEVEGERRGFYGSLEWFEKLIKKNGGGDVLTALEKSIRQDTAEMKVEEAAEQFVQDCHARRLSYEEARAAILADKTKIGEWANRAGEQQFKYAWQQAALDEEECSESELAPVSIPADDLEPPPAPSDGNAEPTDQSLEPDRHDHPADRYREAGAPRAGERTDHRQRRDLQQARV